MEKRRWFDIDGIRKYTALLLGLTIYWITGKFCPEMFSQIAPFFERLLWAFLGANVIEHLIKFKK